MKIKMLNNDEIISIRYSYHKKIYNVSDCNNEHFGSDIIFKKNEGYISGYIDDNKLFDLDNGVLFDVILDVLNNEKSSYKAKIINVLEEENCIICEVEIYRKIDIERDPFVNRVDFPLIKTTKKDDGYSRQSGYYGLKIGSFVTIDSFLGEFLVKNSRGEIIGELSTKAVAFYDEHKMNKIYAKYVGKTVNDSLNVTGIIRMYEIIR